MTEETGTLCEKCNHYIQLGDFPFCPHEPTHAMIVRDEIPGGMWLENYGPKPIKVHSHTERRQVMTERGLIEKDVFCPFPGTDKDPQGIPNPKGYVDAKTLENGAILLTRQRQIDALRRVHEEPDLSGVIRGSFNISGTNRDAIAVQSGDARRSSRIGRRIIKDGSSVDTSRDARDR